MIMVPPQNNRRPPERDEQTQQSLLRKRRKADKTDLFVTDSDKQISTLGRLALRIPEDAVDYYFWLADLCAQHSIDADCHLDML